MIPYGRQDISLEDLAAVKSVLESDFITQGECVPNFEEKLCNITGAEYACVVNSATSALHLACKAIGLGPVILLGQSQIHLLLLLIVHCIVERKLILLILICKPQIFRSIACMIN